MPGDFHLPTALVVLGACLLVWVLLWWRRRRAASGFLSETDRVTYETLRLGAQALQKPTTQKFQLPEEEEVPGMLADTRYQVVVAPAEQGSRRGLKAIEALVDREGPSGVAREMMPKLLGKTTLESRPAPEQQRLWWPELAGNELAAAPEFDYVIVNGVVTVTPQVARLQGELA